jgi:hypothetical protein
MAGSERNKDMTRYLAAVLAAIILSLFGCARHYGLVETDGTLMASCDCIGTFAETSNPGREDGGIVKHYVDTTGVKQRVMKRAVQAGATHIVWLHAYSIGAAAQAYRCPEAPPMAVGKTGADGIWEADLN